MALEPVSPELKELYTACSWNCDLDAIRRILKEHPGAARWGEDRQNRHTPMHVAAAEGKLEAMKLLHDAGAPLDFNNGNGMTLLHIAAQGGHLEAVKWLVEKGLDINAVDNHGYNVLHRAACCGTLGGDPVATVRFLLRRGAKVDAIDENGRDVIAAANESHFDDTRPHLGRLVQDFQDTKARAQREGIARRVKNGIPQDLMVKKPLSLKK